jgi:hypothetical protein
MILSRVIVCSGNERLADAADVCANPDAARLSCDEELKCR